MPATSDNSTQFTLDIHTGQIRRMEHKEAADHLRKTCKALFKEINDLELEVIDLKYQLMKWKHGVLVVLLTFLAVSLLGCKYTVTWKDDYTREDGSPLYPAQIAGYEIKHKCGSVESEPVPTKNPATIYCSGDLHQVYVRTIDTDGRASRWSDGSYTTR